LDLAIKLSREDIKKLLVDHAQRYAEQEKLTNWLASIGMIEYEEVFQKAGFDDLDFLAQHGMSELDLDAMGIKKPGHRLKLQKLYMLKEFLEKLKPKVQEPEDEDEDDDEEEEEEEEAEEEEDEEVEENDEDSDQDEDD
jgi:TATA-binding protein-associated factor Taf7